MGRGDRSVAGSKARPIGILVSVTLGAAAIWVAWRQGLPHFPFYTFALAFLTLAVATAVLPPRLRALSMVFCSLAFGLAAIEGYAVARTPKAIYASFVTPGLQVPAPVVGWTNGAAGVYQERQVDPFTGAVIFDAHYTIDKQHDRLTKSVESGRSVVFWGESFTFGHGIGDGDTLPQRFASLLDGKQRTLNFGVDGYSPAQVLRMLQTGTKDETMGAPLAFIMLTGAFHAVRTSCRETWTATAPHFVKNDGKLVYVGRCQEGVVRAVHSFLDQSAVYQQFIQPRLSGATGADIDLYIDIVAEIAKLAKAKYGVELLVPYVGGPVDSPQALHDAQAAVIPTLAYLPGTGYDDISVIAALRQRGVHVVDMTLRDEAMRGEVIAIPNDRHPTPFANQRRAELVLKELTSMGMDLPQNPKPESSR